MASKPSGDARAFSSSLTARTSELPKQRARQIW